MSWRRTPVDRLQDFRPPFCPRRNCSYQLRATGFRCNHCGKVFSRRALSLTYYRKRPELLRHSLGAHRRETIALGQFVECNTLRTTMKALSKSSIFG